MKQLLLAFSLTAMAATATFAETVTTNGKEYEIETLQDRDLGPGVRYTRFRLPAYPLNVNVLRIDVTNPYNSIETTQASEKLYGTESLVSQAKRQSAAGHVALAGANANFWCVSGQPPFSDQLIGVTYNGNVKNGKIITELNMYSDQWNGGYKHTGILGISEDNKVYSGNKWTFAASVTSPKFGQQVVASANKLVRTNELNMFNSFYGTTRTFRCVDQGPDANGTQHFTIVENCATEVYLKLADGSAWTCGHDIKFVVDQVKTNAGSGTVGTYDLVLVGRDAQAENLAKLAAGDEVTLNYAFINPNGEAVPMKNLVGGNAQVMNNSAMTTYATSETYNSQIYSRTGYGTDADNKTLFICVIDKATDPVYGASAGCSVTVMCDIMKTLGCVNMTNFDAGGSAMMLVGDKIINKTTESSPRAIANGMIAYNVAPDDQEVARLAFYDYKLQAPIYASFSPRIIAYNKYGSIISDDYHGFTLSCPEVAGTCDGSTFTAGGQGVVSTLTASVGNVSVTKDITIVQSELSLRIKPVLIDLARRYPVEVSATVDGNQFTYDPAAVQLTVDDTSVAAVDAKGVLSGVASGKTKLTAKIGDFTDETEVTVEVATAPALPIENAAANPAEWKGSGTSTKSWAITANGNEGGVDVAYTVSSSRSPKVTLTHEATLFSLPDAIRFTIVPQTSQISGVVVGIQPRNQDRAVSVTKTIALSGNDPVDVEFDMSEFGDSNDLIFYPATFKSIGFNISNGTGNYTLSLPAIKAVYKNYTDGVQDIVAEKTENADAPAAYYNLQGVRMDGNNLAPGLYIRRQGQKASKVLVTK